MDAGGSKALRPLLAEFAVERIGTNEIPGRYSELRDVWVVEGEFGVRPIINNSCLSELITKTKVQAEEDDENFFLLETVTKTDIVAEQDDKVRDMNHLLELTTKTHAELEQDDNGDWHIAFDTSSDLLTLGEPQK